MFTLKEVCSSLFVSLLPQHVNPTCSVTVKTSVAVALQFLPFMRTLDVYFFYEHIDFLSLPFFCCREKEVKLEVLYLQRDRLTSFFCFPESKIKSMPAWVFQHSSQGCREYSSSGMWASRCWRRQRVLVRHLHLNLCCGALWAPAIISLDVVATWGKQRALPFPFSLCLLGVRAVSIWGACSPVTASPNLLRGWACDRGHSECGGRRHRELRWVSDHLLRALPGSRSTTLCLCWVHFWLSFFDFFF